LTSFIASDEGVRPMRLAALTISGLDLCILPNGVWQYRVNATIS
jgi:hypothetical protein